MGNKEAVIELGRIEERERILAILLDEFYEVDPEILDRIYDPEYLGEEWVCGDCGTEYSAEVEFCKKDLDDYLGMKRYSSVEEAIMGAAKRSIAQFVPTYTLPTRTEVKERFERATSSVSAFTLSQSLPSTTYTYGAV